MFQFDFQYSPAESLSIQDQRFLKTKIAIHGRPDGHFEIPLPFKQRDIQLPNNPIVAVKHLSSLRMKLSFYAQYRADYIQFMAELIDNDYAERVPPDELEDMESAQILYLSQEIAFSCITESMFHQVSVDIEDNNFIMFLWWVYWIRNVLNIGCIQRMYLS